MGILNTYIFIPAVWDILTISPVEWFPDILNKFCFVEDTNV